MKVELGPREIEHAVKVEIATLLEIDPNTISRITFTKIPKTSGVRATVEIDRPSEPLDGSEQ